MDAQGEVAEQATIATTRDGINRYFRGRERARVVLEVGTHSPWVSRELEALGHEVLVANARRVKLISENYRKTDRVDAELLARLGRADPALLAPICHRKEELQQDLAMIRARDALVRSRTGLINTARNLAKSQGVRLPSCSADGFYKQALAFAPASLKDALEPLLEAIKKLTLEIRTYGSRLAALCETKYPEVQPLMGVAGVGALTALCYVLTLGDPNRYRNGRSVGAFIGLTRRSHQSGASDPQLGITKAGDPYLRKLLVQCAHYILGPFGHDSALRRWGLGLADHGGKGAKKRAAVAVARKLAVLLYRLWVTGEQYEPFPAGPPAKEDMKCAA